MAIPPKEQYDHLIAMKTILRMAAYPRRGTLEEALGLQDFADMIQKEFGREILEENN
jgi:hypothetical protein